MSIAESMKTWLDKYQIDVNKQEVESLCKSLGVTGEKLDECMAYAIAMEQGEITGDEMLTALTTVVNKPIDEVVKLIKKPQPVEIRDINYEIKPFVDAFTITNQTDLINAWDKLATGYAGTTFTEETAVTVLKREFNIGPKDAANIFYTLLNKGIIVAPNLPKEQEGEEYSQPNNPVTVNEYGGNITATIRGKRATAELSVMDDKMIEATGVPKDGKWIWFNRLVNNTGEEGIGIKLLDAVLGYCREHQYAILNNVNAYGKIPQDELEAWYMRKGFVPLDYKQYGNGVLIWRAS